MAGRATLTTVESRKATPDPSTVAASTHRAVGVPMRIVPGPVPPATSAPAVSLTAHGSPTVQEVTIVTEWM